MIVFPPPSPQDFLLDNSLVDLAGSLPLCKLETCTRHTLSTDIAKETWVENTISKVAFSSPGGCVYTHFCIHTHTHTHTGTYADFFIGHRILFDAVKYTNSLISSILLLLV